MAKAFEANTMYCSRLTASTAGTESTAKTTSVVSMSTSTANSGVARSLAFSLVKSFWPSYSGVDGLVLLPHQAHACEDEEGAEHEQQPVEAVEQGHAGEDEDEPHEQRPE